MLRIALALAAALVLAAPAGATTSRFTMDAMSGPTTWDGGDRFLTLHERFPRHEVWRLGSPRTLLAELPPVPGGNANRLGSIAASPHWTVVARQALEFDRQGPLGRVGADVVAIDAAGRVTTLETCARPRPWPNVGSADVDGDLAAWTDTGCAGAPHVMVRDLATGAQRRIDVPEPRTVFSLSVQVRGPWVAVHRTSTGAGFTREISVHDSRTGEIAHTTSTSPSEGAVLAGDGSLVSCDGGQIMRKTAAQPQPQPIPGATGCYQGLAVAQGRIAWIRNADPLRRAPELVTAPLDGSAPPQRLMNRPGWLVGFDGTRAAVGIHSDCLGRRGYAIAGDPADPPEPPPACPVRIGRGPLRLRAGQVVRVPVSCPVGCSITAVAVVAGGRSVGYASRRVLRPGDRFVRVRIARRHAALLARRRSVRISVSFQDRCCEVDANRTVRLR